MGRHKEMVGKTYHVEHRGDHADVECTYLCPYCNQETSSRFTANPDTFDLLERGGFYEHLKCDLCDEISSVRFWQCNKI